MSSLTRTAGTETVNNRRITVRDHALATLADTDTDTDSETVKATVLRECYRQQPSVSLEDVLELNTVIAVPEPGPLEERVAAVLTEIAQHGSWTNTPQAPPASESTSVPTTEGH